MMLRFDLYVFKLFCVGILTFYGQCLQAQNPLSITELMASNENTLLDSDGDAPDWIELYNDSDEPIALELYSLMDKNTKWLFPDATILPYSYLVVFASDKDVQIGKELHTNFKLDDDGEQVILMSPDLDTIDMVIYPELEDDESYGRFSQAQGDWGIFNTPTPGSMNIVDPVRDLQTLTSSHKDGFYPNEIIVHFPNFDLDQSIYYTLDGSIPDTMSRRYNPSTGVLVGDHVNDAIADIPTSDQWEAPTGGTHTACILRAVVYKRESQKSQLLNQFFWIGGNPYSLPVVSVIGEQSDFFDPDEGIYVKGNQNNYLQKGEDWEKPVSVSFFDAKGDLILNQNAGISIGGANTRFKPQKTLRLFARAKYGKRTFDHPFWGADYGESFKRITLRTLSIGPYSKANIMDDLIHEIIDGELDVDYVRRNFAIVYINGVYWGIHSMREHNAQHFIERKYGVSEDSVVTAKARVEEPDAPNDFDNLVSDIGQMDLNNPLDYEEVESRLDIPKYTDYIISNLATSNRDWPHNNVEYWYSTAYDGKIRFIVNDLDATLLVYNDERLDLFSAVQAERLERDKWSRVLIFMQKLLEVPAYREFFNQRLTQVLNTTFAPSRTIAILRDMRKELNEEMLRHIDRWHNPENINQWEKAMNRLEEFLIRRPRYLETQSHQLFGLPIKTYPNPVANTLNLSIDAWQAGKVETIMTDQMGKVVLQSTISVEEGNQKMQLNVSALPSGIYILNTNYKGLNYVQRIVKLNSN